MINNRKVVVTGLGMATALGLDVEECWQKALDGLSGIRKLSYPYSEKSPVQAVGEVTEGDWKKIQEEFKGDAEKEGERRTLFALFSAQSALADAGLVTTESRVKSQESSFCFMALMRPLSILLMVSQSFSKCLYVSRAR